MVSNANATFECAAEGRRNTCHGQNGLVSACYHPPDPAPIMTASQKPVCATRVGWREQLRETWEHLAALRTTNPIRTDQVPPTLAAAMIETGSGPERR
jgi:hypothetical protein